MLLVEKRHPFVWIFFLAVLDNGIACEVEWGWCSGMMCRNVPYWCPIGNICWTYDNDETKHVFTWNSIDNCPDLDSRCFSTINDDAPLTSFANEIQLSFSKYWPGFYYIPSCNDGDSNDWSTSINIKFAQPFIDPTNDDTCFGVKFMNIRYGIVKVSCKFGIVSKDSQIRIATAHAKQINSSLQTSKTTIETTQSSSASLRTVSPLIWTSPTTEITDSSNDVAQGKEGSFTNISLALGISFGLLLFIAVNFIAAFLYFKRRKAIPQATDSHEMNNTDDTSYVTPAQMEALNVHAPYTTIQRGSHETRAAPRAQDTPEYAMVKKKPRKKLQDAEALRGSAQVETSPHTSTQRFESHAPRGVSDGDATINQVDCDLEGGSNMAQKDTGDNEYSRFQDNDLYRSGGDLMETFKKSENIDDVLPGYDDQTGIFVDNDLYTSG